MHHYVLVLVILWLCGTSYSNEPTTDEINKGFILKPWATWGQQARQQNSLRILCIGGSNTANQHNGYVDLLDNFVRTRLSDDEYFRHHSYAWNRGVSGMNILDFTGRLYNFELNTSLLEWPNVVIIDGSVNMDESIKTLPGFERLIRSIAFKYKLKGFPCPDFMFYNMPHLKKMFGMQLNSKKDREKYAKSYRLSGGFEADSIIKRFATYYHFPVISWGEATYDAAVRHFIEFGFTATHPWPYSVDGIHMSPTGGTQFGVDHLLGPFFTDIMKSRKETALRDVSQWPRMYPAGAALIEILGYTSYYHDKNVFTLTDAVVNLEGAEWTTVPLTHTDYCFGSRALNSCGELSFSVPSVCNTLDCQVKVAFIHSWNTSYIGNAYCSLYRKDHDTHGGGRLSNVTISGQAQANGATLPVESLFEGVNVTEGVHTVRCTNLIKDRLSCMTALNVNAVVIV